MSLVSVDDLVEGESILVYRASKEYTGGGNVWIGQEFAGLCSVISSLGATANFVRKWKPCTEAHYSYCEFNGELKFDFYEVFLNCLCCNFFLQHQVSVYLVNRRNSCHLLPDTRNLASPALEPPTYLFDFLGTSGNIFLMLISRMFY
jgi:hypothetical protein